MVISPTVGRIVWYFSDIDQTMPYAAIVTYPHDVRLVNLCVFDELGAPMSRLGVPLVQEGDERPETGHYATWMPYQIGQAKKHAD